MVEQLTTRQQAVFRESLLLQNDFWIGIGTMFTLEMRNERQLAIEAIKVAGLDVRTQEFCLWRPVFPAFFRPHRTCFRNAPPPRAKDRFDSRSATRLWSDRRHRPTRLPRSRGRHGTLKIEDAAVHQGDVLLPPTGVCAFGPGNLKFYGDAAL